MTMCTHIKTLCQSLTFQLRINIISRIRRLLDYDLRHMSSHCRALVLTRADYGNGLLLGSNATDIQRLQRIQNSAAKLMSYNQIWPYHFFSNYTISERINFKILIIMIYHNRTFRFQNDYRHVIRDSTLLKKGLPFWLSLENGPPRLKIKFGPVIWFDTAPAKACLI